MATWMIGAIGLLHFVAAIDLYRQGNYALSWTVLCYAASAIGMIQMANK